MYDSIPTKKKTTNTMSSFPHIVHDELANAEKANHLARETRTRSLQMLHSLGAEETEEMQFQEAPSRNNYDVYYETNSIMQANARILEANDRILEINAQLLAANMKPAIPMDATCVPPATTKKASAKKVSAKRTKKVPANKQVKRRSARQTNRPQVAAVATSLVDNRRTLPPCKAKAKALVKDKEKAVSEKKRKHQDEDEDYHDGFDSGKDSMKGEKGECCMK